MYFLLLSRRTARDQPITWHVATPLRGAAIGKMVAKKRSWAVCAVRGIAGNVHTTTGHEGPEGEYSYSFTLSLTSALEGVGGQRQAPAALPPGKTRYPLYRRLCELQSLWTGAENLAPTGIRSPDRPARSESLYRLSSPGSEE